MKFFVAMFFALGLLIPSMLSLTQAAATGAATAAEAADNCTFVLGFKAIHDMIPDKVGSALPCCRPIRTGSTVTKMELDVNEETRRQQDYRASSR